MARALTPGVPHRLGAEEQVRRIVLSRIGFSPHEGRAIVCIVRGADELTASAANALLKVLEEPPADSVFVLLSARAHELPETVWSRCHVVTFTALPEAFVVEDVDGRWTRHGERSLEVGSVPARPCGTLHRPSNGSDNPTHRP